VKRRMFGIDIDAFDRNGAVTELLGWIANADRTCRYVVTPNVDHVVKLQTNAAFKAAYEGASLVLADGRPVVWASKLLGRTLPGTVPGSDLVPDLFEAVSRMEGKTLSVFLLGAAPGVAERAGKKIHERWKNIDIVGVYSPPFGFEKDPEESAYIGSIVNSARADLLVFGVGAPKQEIWIHQHSSMLRVKVALCVGATIDFLAEEKKRAPEWVQKIGFEWIYRLLSEPRRLWKRYVHDLIVFPFLFLKELLGIK